MRTNDGLHNIELGVDNGIYLNGIFIGETELFILYQNLKRHQSIIIDKLMFVGFVEQHDKFRAKGGYKLIKSQ